MRRIIGGAVIAALLGTVTFAQEAEQTYQAQIEMRQGMMLYYAANLGVLGAMAKGETPYDAAAAQKAADNLDAAAKVDLSIAFPEGSDNTQQTDTGALPDIWKNMADVQGKFVALGEATNAMKLAAGKDLESLKGAMQALGGACGSCHKAYRAPE